MITEKLMSAGSWSIRLKPSTPASVRTELDVSSRAFSLIAITPARLNTGNLSNLTAANVRSAARYVGVYRSRPDEFTIEGASLAVFLGDEDKKGSIATTALTRSAGTLDNWFTDIFTGTPNGFSKGTITNTGSTHTGSYIYVDRRSVMQTACEACNAEWRINNDLTVDAAAAATLWTWTPAVMASRTSDGRDLSVVGIKTVELDQATDCEDYSTAVGVIARGDGGASYSAQTAASIPYYHPGGSALDMTRVIDTSAVSRTDAASMATQQLARFSSMRRAVALNVDEPDLRRLLAPGDRIYVFDPETPGLFDTANQVQFRGRITFPIVVRVLGYQWPVRQGLGVYLLTSESSSRVIDLTDWYVAEEGTSRLEIGAADRTVNDGGTIASGNLSIASATGDVPKAVTLDAWTSYTPTYANFSLGNGTVDAGYYRIGRTVIYRGSITMGSTSSVTGVMQVSLPVAAKASTWQTGSVDGEDNSGSWSRTSGTAEINPAIYGTGVAFASSGNAGWAATVPFTWATSDIIRWTITYEAAAS